MVRRIAIRELSTAWHSGVQIKRLMVGTPHRGATLALTAAVGPEKRLFLSASQVLQLVSDPRYPALYELLPPKGSRLSGMMSQVPDIYQGISMIQPWRLVPPA
ncbi:MAG: hypothetical protein WA708_13995 [Acidobacteriaceae bacterium]